MKVLVACEYSGTVRDAFTERGHDAMSCDILPTESPGPHYQGDVMDILDDGWDMLIGHPPCTYLTNSGVQWLRTKPGRWESMKDGQAFFNALWHANIDRICLENPIPHGHATLPPYTQLIQPWQFGHKEMKATCLWLRNLNPLIPTDVVGPPPEDPEERKSWERIHRMPPNGWNGEGRQKERSLTYSGIANAMAEQWSQRLPYIQEELF